MVRAEIDPNVRIENNLTYVGVEDLNGPVKVGQVVEVFESESGAHGFGIVDGISEATGIVYLQVDFSTLTVVG